MSLVARTLLPARYGNAVTAAIGCTYSTTMVATQSPEFLHHKLDTGVRMALRQSE